MRLRHLQWSSVVVEDGDTSVLCDPWLLDGAFDGSWSHALPLEFDPGEYADVDYVYLSHLPPDHGQSPTMQRLDADIPVLVHDAGTDDLRERIEGLGFEVIELAHAQRTHFAGDLHVNVLATDDADGSAPTDSMAVFDDGENVLVDASDSRWPLSERACAVVADRYDSIDLLLVQYAPAKHVPLCTDHFSRETPLGVDHTSHEGRIAARTSMIDEWYADAEAFVDALEPRHFVPLVGSHGPALEATDSTQYAPAPTRDAAFWHFLGSPTIESGHSDPILLNSGAYFDLDTAHPSEPFSPVERQFASDTVVDGRPAPVETADRSLSKTGGGNETSRPETANATDEDVLPVDDRLVAHILDGPRDGHISDAHNTDAHSTSDDGERQGSDVDDHPHSDTMRFLHT
ncbi:MAG: MBL fold metallo-hydrolase [Halolamina sp.]